ncbi:hypothetical protein KDA08_05550, partial [Candidatus Saccharibacteria bacterium]|nr:hypothetical protein [Candidatus Saccharibacteria bacterium]
SYPVLLDGSILKASDSAGIYLYDSGKRWTFSPDGWRAWGKQIDYTFTSNQISQLTNGGLAPILVSDGSTDYIVDGGKKYTFTPNIETAWGLTGGSFQQMTIQSLAKLKTGSNMGTLIRQPNGAVYKVSSGERYGIPSIQDFNQLGYRWGWVFNLSNSAVGTVTYNGVLSFAPGSLIRLPNGGVYLIDDGLNSYGVPSIASFNNYGFKWTNVRNFGSNTLNGYTPQVLHNLIETPSNKHYIADNGRLLLVSDTAYSSSEYDFASNVKSTLTDNLISQIGVSSSLTQFIRGSGTTVYKVVNGEKRPISSQQSFYNSGGSWDQLTKVTDSFLDTLPTGGVL